MSRKNIHNYLECKALRWNNIFGFLNGCNTKTLKYKINSSLNIITNNKKDCRHKKILKLLNKYREVIKSFFIVKFLGYLRQGL